MRRIEQRRVIMLALIPVVLVTAACSSATKATSQPAPSHVATTTPSAAPAQDFVSKQYSFRLTLTTDWSESDAKSGWDGKQLQGLDSPVFADFTDEVTDHAFAAAAAPVAEGTQLATWRAAMVLAAPSVCTESPSAKQTTLGGEPALAWTATCSDGYEVNKLAALHGHQGYMTLFASETGSDKAEAHRIFESIRQSFQFTG